MSTFVEYVRSEGSHLRIIYKTYMEGLIYCHQAQLPFPRTYIGKSGTDALRAAEMCAKLICQYELPERLVSYQQMEEDMAKNFDKNHKKNVLTDLR